MKSTIYKLFRLSNDINAILKGQIGNRIWDKLIGRMMGRMMRR
jgi:hypothetical protein